MTSYPVVRRKGVTVEVSHDAPGEALSEMYIAPMALDLNQSSAVCLPLVSDNKRLIWVPLNEISLQLVGAAELDEAFDRFPYLTAKRTAALAQRCSLQPDQVKVWFMAQRLRYGISWDYNDIAKVRRKFKSSRGQEELHDRQGEEVKEVRDENEKRKRVKKDKDSKVEEDKRNFQKKRKRTTTDEKGKKRAKQGEEGEIKGDEDEQEGQKSSQAEKTLLTRHKKKKKKPKAIKRLPSVQECPAHSSFVVPDEALEASLQLIRLSQTPEGKTEMHAESTNHSGGDNDVGQPEELTEVNNNLVVDASPTVPQQQHSHVYDACKRPTRLHYKSQTQLSKMKAAFVRCQYPDSEDYNQMTIAIDIPRCILVQWFGDMRYYIKKGRPGWMNQEEYNLALDNVLYRQQVDALIKRQSTLMADRSESEGNSVPVPPESK